MYSAEICITYELNIIWLNNLNWYYSVVSCNQKSDWISFY